MLPVYLLGGRWLIKCTQKTDGGTVAKHAYLYTLRPVYHGKRFKKWGLCTRCRIGCACMLFFESYPVDFPTYDHIKHRRRWSVLVVCLGGRLRSVCFWLWAVACLLWRCGCLFPSVAVSDHVKKYFCIQYTLLGNIDSVGRSGVSFRYLNTFKTFRQPTARSKKSNCLNCFELSEK